MEDPDEELKAVEKEEQDSLKKQKELFGNQPNEPPEDGDIDDEE